jgi:hypothetical protein
VKAVRDEEPVDAPEVFTEESPDVGGEDGAEWYSGSTSFQVASQAAVFVLRQTRLLRQERGWEVPVRS